MLFRAAEWEVTDLCPSPSVHCCVTCQRLAPPLIWQLELFTSPVLPKWSGLNQYRSYTCFVSSSQCWSILSQPGIMAVTEMCPGWSRSKYKGMHVWLWQGNEPCHKHYSNIGFVRYYQGDSSILTMIHPWPMGLNNSIFQWYHTRVQEDDHILPRTRNSGLTAPQPCCGACIEVMFLEKPSLSHHHD